MSIDHIETLHSRLPQLFKDILLPPDWTDDWIIERVDRPDTLDKLNDVSAPGPFEWLSASVAPPSFSVPDIPYTGPGAPQRVPGGPPPTPDAIAFYLPFHYFRPTWWGIYLVREMIDILAADLVTLSGDTLSARDAVQASKVFAYGHEAFHHMVESLATRLEVTHRRALYIEGFEGLYQRHKGTDGCVEEALATAHGYRTALKAFGRHEALKPLRQSLAAYIESLPPGYRRAGDYFEAGAFRRASEQFAEENHIAAVFPKGEKPAIWGAFSQAFRGMANIKSRTNYLIHRHSPLGQRHRMRDLRPRDLRQKLQELAGCVFVRQGGNHEIWRNREGRPFAIPRHPGDLSTGTLVKIIKQAGLAMSLEQFLRA